jgi:adenosylcobinamide-GDP ribazoletransferase
MDFTLKKPLERWAEFRIVAAFLSSIPISLDAKEAKTGLGDAAAMFSLVGSAIGAVAGAGLVVAAWFGLHPMACAFVAVLIAVILSGALHEDGLADFCDGLGGGKDGAAKLKIMRDSRIGTFGVLAVVLVVGLKVSSLTGLPGSWWAFGALVASAAISRGVMPFLMLFMEPARKSGLSFKAGKPDLSDAVLGAVFALALSIAIFGFVSGIIIVLVSVIAAGIVGVLANRQVNGHTGDVLGAAQQASEVAAIMAAAAMAG